MFQWAQSNPTSTLGDRWFRGTSVQNPSIPSSPSSQGRVYPSPTPAWETHPGPLLSCDVFFRRLGGEQGSQMVALGRPRGREGSSREPKMVPKCAPRGSQRGPLGAQRAPKGRPGTASGTPGEALGRPGASDPKRKEGYRVFRLKNGPDFRGPGEEFSMIFVTNFCLEFLLIFYAVLAAKLPSKSRPKGGQGGQKPRQSLP